MEKGINFEFLNQNKVVCSVNDGVITYYTDNFLEKVMCPKDFHSLDYFFRERTFPETRVNCKQVLKHLGLTYFDAYEVCKKTHGALVDDTFWIRFEGESYVYEDVRVAIREGNV